MAFCHEKKVVTLIPPQQGKQIQLTATSAKPPHAYYRPRQDNVLSGRLGNIAHTKVEALPRAATFRIDRYQALVCRSDIWGWSCTTPTTDKIFKTFHIPRLFLLLPP